jgi:uncharacterized membrane protein YeaQ/YmgE (transglycosylase-associated protein family)
MNSGLGLIGDVVVGIIGAFLGRWLFSQFDTPGFIEINHWVLVVSVISAVLLLFMVNLAWRLFSPGKRADNT